MNIKQAKQQIKNAMTAYFAKDDLGNYEIPVERQRPVMLIGPPGIGKTAVMEQIAAELGVGLLSYSMTHHTRQSALGLPFIVHKTYGDMECDVSEYTMSEIISSVYDMMERSGVKEGILFLDEINCVSETLRPVMLQFLQYKVFGRHRVPDGWIVVTAGNPPEYNNSVRDFDIVTWDRLKRIDVEPDFDAWKEYAYSVGVHPAVMTYLDNKKDHFYSVESTVKGRQFVTARGWDDLSRMIILYEKKGIPVDELLIGQYLQNRSIAKDFAVYYDLFNKYRSDYQVDTILAGEASDEIKERAKAAKFDERLAFLGLLLDAVFGSLKSVMEMDGLLTEYMEVLKTYRVRLMESGGGPCGVLESLIRDREEDIRRRKEAGAVSEDEVRRARRLNLALRDLLPAAAAASDADQAFAAARTDFDTVVKELRAQASKAGAALTNMFNFCDEVFPDGQELLILVTELTLNQSSAAFIGRYGCKEYFAHNQDLMFYERQKEIIAGLEGLEPEE